MADTKISDLTAITGADTAADDDFVIVDTSAAQTKRITRDELRAGLYPGIDDNSSATAVTIDASGHVGINEASPTADLHVSGDMILNARHPSSSSSLGIGTTALQNSSASSATAIGVSALKENTTGVRNTALGQNALRDNTTASNSTAVGYNALAVNNGGQNQAFGAFTLDSNTTGIYNTAMGYAALSANVSGNYNVAVGGRGVLDSCVSGLGNVAVGGYSTLGSLDDGDYNVALGHLTGQTLEGGSNNVLIGRNAGQDIVDADSNVCIGYVSGNDISSGQVNTCVGFNAGNTLTTGSSNTLLGRDATPSAADVDHEITLGSSSVTALRVPGVDFYIDSVGVGIGTSSPSEALTVIGNGVFGDSTTKYNTITINGGHVGDGGNDYGLTINSFEPAITLLDRSSGAGSGQIRVQSNGAFWLLGDTTNDGTIGHTANTTDFVMAKFEPDAHVFNISGSEAMRVDSSGNVGIGVSTIDTTLSTKLHVAGTIRTDPGASAANPAIVFDHDNFADADANYIMVERTSESMRFYVNASERMRIGSSGEVLVGTTDDSQWNNTSGSGIVLGNDGRIESSATDSDCMRLNRIGTDGGIAYFYKTGVLVGNISVTGSATSYNTSSDYRLKTDAQPMTGASARLQALNPVNFEWVADGTRVDGFLAHEAQAVVPESVTGTKDAMRDEEYEVTPAVLDEDGNEVTPAVMGTRSVPDYQGIDQSKLVPLLTAALQEALTKIDALETRITALEG
jgi:hypothetical protein